MDIRNCLLCYTECDLYHRIKESESSGLSKISMELHAVFLLRNIFEVPKETVQAYLKTGTNPSDWIVICKNCENVVEKGKKMFKDILDASRRFRKVKGEIIQFLRKNKSRTETQPGTPGIGTTVTNETRKFVTEYNYSQSVVDPFIGGDCKAAQLIFSGRVLPNYEVDVPIVFPVKMEVADYESESEADWESDPGKEAESSDGDFDLSAHSNLTSFENNVSEASRSNPTNLPDDFKHVAGPVVDRSDGQKLWNCNCGRSYFFPDKLRRHVKEANMNPSDMFQCSLCDKRFRRKWVLQRHEKSHNKDASISEETPIPQIRPEVIHEPKELCKMEDGTEFWKCTCSKIYLNRKTLDDHIRKEAEEVPKTIMQCPICKSTFKRRVERNQHMKKTHGMIMSAIQMEQVNQSEKNPSNSQTEIGTSSGPSTDSFAMEEHKELGRFTNDDGTEEWKCTCGKGYASQNGAHRHVREANMDPSTWLPCEHCEKSFRRPSELKRHMGKVHKDKL